MGGDTGACSRILTDARYRLGFVDGPVRSFRRRCVGGAALRLARLDALGSLRRGITRMLTRCAQPGGQILPTLPGDSVDGVLPSIGGGVLHFPPLRSRLHPSFVCVASHAGADQVPVLWWDAEAV